MHILVTFGSKRGGTAELAAAIADEMRTQGFDTELCAADRASSAAGYDAVVVGGALYARRWHRAARRFVRHNQEALRAVPTYLFSSGPLDDSATAGEIPPVPQVTALMDRVHARGHATFGGRLSPDAQGFPASAMAKSHAGDWRDFEQVRKWADSVAGELKSA